MRKIVLTISIGCLITALLAFPLIKGTGNTTNKREIRVPVKNSEPDSVFSNNEAREAEVLYSSLHLQHLGLSKEAFEYALKGFNYLHKKPGLFKKNILSICDFSQSSKNKRLYIIDVEKQKLILNTYVAHGKNSGSEFAQSFSNDPESLKSSLGFYVTRSTYQGGHGLSLKIEGLENGINDKAEQRNIVIHGSDYVGDDFLRNNAFNGRSFGCPAVPAKQTPMVINTLKNGSCLFIYHPSKKYLAKSKILNA
jgi:hypothetical protein